MSGPKTSLFWSETDFVAEVALGGAPVIQAQYPMFRSLYSASSCEIHSSAEGGM